MRKNILLLSLVLNLFIIGCGDDRAGHDNNVTNDGTKQGVLGAVYVTPTDKDGDGLSDKDELLYHTDINNPDTDGDGLLDGEEIKKYDTNVTN